MHNDKSSHGYNPNRGVFMRIVSQSFLLLLLQICAAYGENTTIESCQTEINWKPIHYYIKISTDIYKNKKSFHGQVGIDGVVLQDTNELLLHSGLNLTKAFYTIEDQRHEIDLELAQETNKTVIFNLNQTLMKDQNFYLNIEYNGNMEANPAIYVSSFFPWSGMRDVVSTSLYPIGARFVFPCLDLPRFKAKFSIEVARPLSMVALSNMDLIKTSLPDPNVGNQVWDSFQPTPIMSAYLVSIFICDDYQNISLPRNSFWFPRVSKDSVQFNATETSNLILNSMETFTGINYTLPKLDYFIINDGGYGVFQTRTWGLITWDNATIQMAGKKDYLITEAGWLSYVELAHAIVYQWTENLVTSRYWCYFWLNQDIKTFISYHIVNQIFPLTKSSDLFTSVLIDSSMAKEQESPTYLVNEDKCCTDELFEWSKASSTNFTGKGAAIMQMVESNILSNGTFRKGIQRYLNNNMYGTVTNKELWEAFQEVIEETSIGTIPDGTALETVMDTWTRNGGFPIVHMHRFENGSVAVRQEFFLHKESKSNVYWWIPLTYTTMSKNDFSSLGVQEWLSPSGDLKILETNISDNEWIIFNIQQKGYYKVNYDSKTWEIITDHLMNGNIEDIHPINRASLLKDAFMLAQKGFINYSVALNLSKYLVREKNYFPLKAGEEVLSNLLDSLRGTSLYYKFMDYCKFAFNGIYQNVRLGHFNVTDLPSSWLRLLAIRNSCRYKLDHCGQQALQAAKSIINQEIQEDQIDPSLRYQLWCSAIQLGGNEVFDYVKNKYTDEFDHASVNFPIFESLFCSTDSEEINSLVSDILFRVRHFEDMFWYFFSVLFKRIDVFCPTVIYMNEHYDAFVPYKRSAKSLALEFNSIGFKPIDDECRNQTVELISKLDNTTYIAQNATTMDENLISNINSWLDEQNLTMEAYSEENDTSITAPNLFLRQGEFDFWTTNIPYKF